MKFTLEDARGILVHACRSGEVILRLPAEDSGTEERSLASYRSSFILSKSDQLVDWPVSHAGELALHHFESVWQLQPEIVLLGSGQRLIFPAAAIRQRFASEGIGFEAMDTAAACRTFNVLIAEGRDVMAMLIVE